MEIQKGYLIYLRDFRTFDAIAKIVNDCDEVIAFFAPGVKKINSSNGRSFNIGNLIEVEIFRSLSLEKLSKLKKSITCREIPWGSAWEWFQILAGYTSKFTNVKNIYSQIETMFNLQNEAYCPNYLRLVSWTWIAKTEGYGFNFESCVICGSKKRIIGISLYSNGIICKDCSEKNSWNPFNQTDIKLWIKVWKQTYIKQKFSENFAESVISYFRKILSID